MQTLFFIVISLAAFLATAFDADWFMGHRRFSFLVTVHGREKARVILLTVFATMVVVGTLWFYVSG
ncbi:MAG: Imm17 family immunity protein [Anaerolineae bacterium]